MNYKKQIKEYLEKSDGIITTSYCKENSIPTVYLSRLAKEGLLTRITRGLYIDENANYDEFYFFQYRFKRTVFSYETALFLLGLIDIIPQVLDITVPRTYKFNNNVNDVNVYYVDTSIFNLGITEVKTMYGNIVKVYSYERILCDFIANKENMDIEVYVKIVKSYSGYKKKNIHELYRIAREMRMEEKVKDIMEVVYE